MAQKDPTTARLKYFRGNRRMQTKIVYRFDEDDETAYEAIAITAKTVTIRGVGTQARMAKQAAEQWRAELPATDDTPEEKRLLPPEPTPDMDPEQNIKYNAYVRWATCAAGTQSIAVVKRGKKSKELDPDAPESWPWETSSLAGMGWDQPQGVLDIKTDLFEAWEKAVQAANPGIFGRALTSTAKKKTGVISIS
jgi:hypothetical protein